MKSISSIEGLSEFFNNVLSGGANYCIRPVESGAFESVSGSTIGELLARCLLEGVSNLRITDLRSSASDTPQGMSGCHWYLAEQKDGHLVYSIDRFCLCFSASRIDSMIEDCSSSEDGTLAAVTWDEVMQYFLFGRSIH